MINDNEKPSPEAGAKFSGEELAQNLRSDQELPTNDEAGRAQKVERNEEAATGFEIVVDHEKLAQLDSIPDHMREWLARLPESLSFDEQITLIVGENGSGKTQFARALTKVLERDRIDYDGRSRGGISVRDEPAGEIPEALSLSTPRSGNFYSTFVESSELMHTGREWIEEQRRLKPAERSEEDHRLSSRQVFDLGIEHQIQFIDQNRRHILGEHPNSDKFPVVGGDAVLVYDEPEIGLSPDRQLGLEQMLVDFAGENTLLVPTNNLALYLSDMPRLDLFQPERGVHRPSEYGESGKIEFHKADAEK